MSELIKELENEKSILMEKMLELKRQIGVLDGMIIRKKTEVYGVKSGETVNKKNIDRIFNETLILELIQKHPNGLRTSEISRRLRVNGTQLNSNSVRTYITRMRDKGLIYKKSAYHWAVKE